MTLYFEWQTAVLSVPAVILLALSFSLTRVFRNRLAAKTLAALLLVLVGVITPWMIGFAGFYDQWPWLTFLPVAITLWVPALLWLFVHSIITGGWPSNWKLVLLPGAIQFTYLGSGFLLPLSLKTQWATFSTPLANLVFNLALILSFITQTYLSLKLLAQYKFALARVRSDDGKFAMAWLSRFIPIFAVLWVLWSIISAWNFFAPLGYDGFMVLYLLLAGFAVFLGIEGWRYSFVQFPTLDSLVASNNAHVMPSRNWREQGEIWAIRIRAEGWAHDPDLTIQTLARLLGTNTAYVSRALNEGLGTNFSNFINHLRCERVATCMDEGATDDVLTLALKAGFSSKASFNRAFQAVKRMSPSAYRAQVSKPK